MADCQAIIFQVKPVEIQMNGKLLNNRSLAFSFENIPKTPNQPSQQYKQNKNVRRI